MYLTPIFNLFLKKYLIKYFTINDMKFIFLIEWE